ncbi:MAG: MFS transporter [Nitrososphaerota archaeon]|jgi:MFS family permease|nr:MFS transporter [Nitrososphaerota archaeon]MDG6937126.1 MFS transporter [Nitrososphaerota archaeon]MDG6962449.1 MFS transporter [Nitrososphaerota archaeon]MDG6971525.1 MFS transporter [Nitrososphaerota archaeon]MDG6972368.1 MFS transporter [Nitrososphaerota archaeon]
MLLEAYIYGLGSFAAYWFSALPSLLGTLALVWSPLWLIIGIAFAGPLSDALGRRTTFFLTMALYAVGSVGMLISGAYQSVLFFLALLLFAAGGEMNTIMAANHELMPRKYRSRTMFWEINFINVGGVLLGIVGIVAATSYGSLDYSRDMIAVIFLPLLLLLIYSRLKIPESVRWLEAKGKTAEAAALAQKLSAGPAKDDPPVAAPALQAAAGGRRPSTATKIFVVTAIAGANAVGFGLMTYSLGYYYYASQIASIILVANLVGFFAGAVVSIMAEKWSRKKVLTYSMIGTFIVTWGIYFLNISTAAFSNSLITFYVVLVILNVFVGAGYLAEDTLKGEVWNTTRRGTLTALTRFLSIGAAIPAYYIGLSLSENNYILFNALVWTVGMVAVLVWHFRGIETGQGVSIAVASGEGPVVSPSTPAMGTPEARALNQPDAK